MSKRQSLYNKWKLLPHQYDEILRQQGGVCAICLQSETAKVRGKVKRLAIDHDHECCSGCSKCIRSLLCHNCNVGLGFFQDDAALLRRAALYLDRYDDK